MQRNGWQSVSEPGETRLVCANCGKEVDLLYPSVDHHPSVCPACDIPCLFFSWKNQLVQVLPNLAPDALRRMIEWAQRELNELEFIDILVAIDQIATGLTARSVRKGSGPTIGSGRGESD